MRSITIHNKKLRDLLNEKDEWVKQGRKKSIEIEAIDKKILETDELEKKITASVNPEELIKEGEALRDEINKKIGVMEAIGEKIMQAKLAGIPKKTKDLHWSLRKDKEEAERDRNKIALRVQKIKDRAIPIIQKEMKPLLEKYEDIETATVKGEKIVINVFNHLEEWKDKFDKKSNPAPTQKLVTSIKKK